MPVDPLFWLATAAFAWGLSLASYRWFAVYNGWPMGEWQAHRPGLPIAIGLLSVMLAILFAIARGGATVFVLPLFGIVCGLGWTAITRVGAQSALLLAPLSVVALLIVWTMLASHVPAEGPTLRSQTHRLVYPAATDREVDIADRDRGITRTEPRVPSPLSR
jgi:hypothetical protein